MSEMVERVAAKALGNAVARIVGLEDETARLRALLVEARDALRHVHEVVGLWPEEKALLARIQAEVGNG